MNIIIGNPRHHDGKGVPFTTFNLGVIDPLTGAGWVSSGWRIQAGQILAPSTRVKNRYLQTAWLTPALVRRLYDLMKDRGYALDDFESATQTLVLQAVLQARLFPQEVAGGGQ